MTDTAKPRDDDADEAPSSRANITIRIDRTGVCLEASQHGNGNAELPGMQSMFNSLASIIPVIPGALACVAVAVAGGAWYTDVVVFVAITAATFGVIWLSNRRST